MERERLIDLYNLELSYLREMGALFRQAHPEEARFLALEAGQCGDPHVERLLEGFAFLTARVRGKIEDDYPEISAAFLNVVFPHYLRPIPSTTIVQFSPRPDPTALLRGIELPVQTPLQTRPVDGVPCRYETCYPVTMWPVSVVAAQLAPDQVVIENKPPEAESLLTLQLTCQAPEGWRSLQQLRTLRFYLDGREPLPSTLYELLFARLCGVWLRGKNAGEEIRVIRLPVDAVMPVGFEPREGLWPYPARAFPGYLLLQEYFAFPNKFLFFDLGHWERLVGSDIVGPIEVLFFFNEPPRTRLNVRPEAFKLGCAPATNLFRMSAEPIVLDRLRTEYPVVPSYRHLAGYEVYAIDSVTSGGGYLDDQVDYLPFYALRHHVADRNPPAYWIDSRRLSVREGDRGTDVTIAFTNPDYKPTRPSAETVTVRLRCTNRDLPARLPFGGGQSQLTLETEALVSRVESITRPTGSYRPSLGHGAQWRLISNLALNHLSLDGGDEQRADALRELLSVYDFVADDATRKMIRGVDGVGCRRVAGRLQRGLGKPLGLGLEVDLRLDEDLFPGSMAFLFGSVLERFLGAYVSINAFTQTVLTSKQGKGIWKRWPARTGCRQLL